MTTRTHPDTIPTNSSCRDESHTTRQGPCKGPVAVAVCVSRSRVEMPTPILSGWQPELLRLHGGQYCSPSAADQASVQREQPAVDLQREVAELKAGPTPNPF